MGKNRLLVLMNFWVLDFSKMMMLVIGIMELFVLNHVSESLTIERKEEQKFVTLYKEYSFFEEILE